MTTYEKSLLVCPPKYYDVIYEINAWMDVKNPPAHHIANQQWDNYRKTLEEVGFKLEYLEPKPTVPDLVFTANHGLVKGNKVVLANMKYQERRLELSVYKEWFEKKSYETIEVDYFFEGEGDAFIVNNKLFCGFGFRTQKEAGVEIMKALEIDEVVSLELIDEYFYHLDTCFAPLSESLAVVYPQALSKESLESLSDNFELITVNKEEADIFACNLVVNGNKIVLPAGCMELNAELSKRGFQVFEVELDQYRRAGGSAKCLCLYI